MSSKFVISNRENDAFSFFLFLHFRQLFFLFPSLVWHLWQQKNNIAVGRRALRIRARKLSSPTCLPIDRWCLNDCFAMSVFHIMVCWKKKMHFSPIFSLFGAISPHILIRRCEKSVLRSSSFILRRKPIYQINSPLCLFWHYYYFVATFSSLPCARKQIEDEGKRGAKEKAASKHGALTRPCRAKRL